jgi:O-antigen biosynthesis protein
MRVNLGCGQAYLDGWVNVDSDTAVHADVYCDAFDFVREFGDEIEELYMGHFLDRLIPNSAVGLLSLIRDCLPAGALVSVVTPDIRAIFGAYRTGEITDIELDDRFVCSNELPSRHVWCYDTDTLAQLFREAGYVDIEPIDVLNWSPVHRKSGPESRWQCGIRGIVPDARPDADGISESERLAREYAQLRDPAIAMPVTANDMLLARIRQLRGELEETEDRARELDSARVFLSRRLRALAKRAFPAGGRRRSMLMLGLDTAREGKSMGRQFRRRWREITRTGPPSYAEWCRGHDPTAADLRDQADAARRFTAPVTVHCYVVATDGNREVDATLESILAQSWPHWKTTVLGDSQGGRSPGHRVDPRIDFVQTNGAEVVSVANDLLGVEPRRDFVLYLEAGDRIAPDCFFQIGAVAHEDPVVDLVYWDDDLLGGRLGRSDVQFRPTWSPEMLLSGNYIGRSFAVRHRRLLATNGLEDSLRDGSPLGAGRWWHLLLRLGVDGEHVVRVPRVLTHLISRPEPSPREGQKVVSAHLESEGLPATAVLDGDSVKVVWDDADPPHVTVIIPTQHNRPLLTGCLRSLARTEYPTFDVIVVDNGARTLENEQWYRLTFGGVDLHVEWWDGAFNYSAVNNAAARKARGDILIFLNDDTDLVDPNWMREIVNWARRPEIGAVGLQLVGPDGSLQHGGVILGLNGFADHLFQGMAPGSPSLLGSTSWYRNTLAITGACLGLRRNLFEEIGGFDERLRLCGSDVVLGLDAVLAGKRNLCSPFSRVLHLESVTRGPNIPAEDFYVSYWRYQRWIHAGDPYFSPNLSLESRVPQLRRSAEPKPEERLSRLLDYKVEAFRQRSDSDETTALAEVCRATDMDVRSIQALHEENRAPFDPQTINWFVPALESPFYGGINTALRLADYLARTYGVRNQFVVCGTGNELFFRSGFSAAFPTLADAPIAFHDLTSRSVEHLPPADVSIATLWETAYTVARFPHTRRKFYLIQDFEPMFNPAGTIYALTEESYRLGLYGLCNTQRLLDIYEENYGGRGIAFTPAVDRSLFHPRGREWSTDSPTTIFVYARPGHWRNCWELASVALKELKRRLGDRVRIVTAGSWARPADLGSGIKHLGLLDYRETANLYRHCDIGIALTVSEHPSYLPLELMACGVAVVAFDNPAGSWLLHDQKNCLLARRTADGLSSVVERLVRDVGLRRELTQQGLHDIDERFSSWDKTFSGIYRFLGDPEHLATGP